MITDGLTTLPLLGTRVPERRYRPEGSSTVVDCLLIGFNDTSFEQYVELVRSMGTDSGAWQDLRLAFVNVDGRPLRALEALTALHPEAETKGHVFHNSDFLWPVITYLGSFLAARGFTFDYVNLFHREKEELRRKLLEGRVRTVVVTTTLYVSAAPIQEIVAFVRSVAPDVTIIIGGPYIANQAKLADEDALAAMLDYLGGDVYVIGQEGELALAQVLAAMDEGADLARVPNLGYRTGGRFKFTPKSVESNALETNMVDYSIFEDGAFNEFVTTRTAKSCPFSCAFCGFPQRAGKYTYLDVDCVERELERLSVIPSVSTVTFIDDTFNVPKVRFKEILRMMIRRQFGLRWNCFYRSDHGDEEAIHLMKEAGCEGVFLGVESGSDSMLKRMNKTARRADYLSALKTFNEVGISTYASLIIGFPGETDETVAETISLLELGRPDFFRAQLWYCDRVTPIWQKRDEYGIRGESFNWSHNTMDSKRACELIEHLFTTVQNSVWLPQAGFEQWSVFYLLRRGMSMAQIKTFLRAFNAIVADQMTADDDAALRPDLYADLKTACRFEVTYGKARSI